MRKWLTLIALVLGDYLSKQWVFAQLPLHSKWALIPGLSLFCCHNTGMAWSMGANSPIFVTGLGLCLLALFSYQLALKPSWTMILIVAGGIGNLIDRLSYGAVRDFILLSYGTLSWPVFNFADLYLTLGAFFLLFDVLRHKNPQNCSF